MTPSAGEFARLTGAVAARIVSTETEVDLAAGWAGRIHAVHPELAQVVVDLTPVGPQVWIDLKHLKLASRAL